MMTETSLEQDSRAADAILMDLATDGLEPDAETNHQLKRLMGWDAEEVAAEANRIRKVRRDQLIAGSEADRQSLLESRDEAIADRDQTEQRVRQQIVKLEAEITAKKKAAGQLIRRYGEAEAAVERLAGKYLLPGWVKEAIKQIEQDDESAKFRLKKARGDHDQAEKLIAIAKRKEPSEMRRFLFNRAKVERSWFIEGTKPNTKELQRSPTPEFFDHCHQLEAERQQRLDAIAGLEIEVQHEQEEIAELKAIYSRDEV